MTHKEIKEKVINRINITPMGMNRLYKYLLGLLQDENKVKTFLVREGYTESEIKRVIYQISYKKRQYQIVKLNTATLIERGI